MAAFIGLTKKFFQVSHKLLQKTLNELFGQPNKKKKLRIYYRQSESRSVVSNSLGPHGLYSPWNSPGQNTGVGSLSLLQGIFSTQGTQASHIAGGFFTS